MGIIEGALLFGLGFQILTSEPPRPYAVPLEDGVIQYMTEKEYAAHKRGPNLGKKTITVKEGN